MLPQTKQQCQGNIMKMLVASYGWAVVLFLEPGSFPHLCYVFFSKLLFAWKRKMSQIIGRNWWSFEIFERKKYQNMFNFKPFSCNGKAYLFTSSKIFFLWIWNTNIFLWIGVKHACMTNQIRKGILFFLMNRDLWNRDLK